MSDTHIAPPGWYDDGSGRNRWWDGQQWGQFAPTQPPPPVVVNVTQPTRLPVNGAAVAGFIIGLLAFLTSWVPGLGLFCAVLGIIFSGVGLWLVKQREGSGKGLASAGMVLSVVSAFIFFLLLMIPLAIQQG